MNFFVAAIVLAVRHYILAQLPGDASISIAVFCVELYQLYNETPRTVWSPDASTDTSVMEKVFGLPPALVTASLPPATITYRNYIGLPDLTSESLFLLYQPIPSVCLLTDSPVGLDIGISPHASLASAYKDTHGDVNPVHETTHEGADLVREITHEDVDLVRETIHEDLDLVHETTHEDADPVREDTVKDAYLVREDTREGVCPVPVGIFEDVCPVPVDVHEDVRSVPVDVYEDIYSVQELSTVSRSVAVVLLIIIALGLVLGFAIFGALRAMALRAKLALEDGIVRSCWYTAIGITLACTPTATSIGRVLITTKRLEETVDSYKLFMVLLVIALVLPKLVSAYSDTGHLCESFHKHLGSTSAGLMDDSVSFPLSVVESSVEEPDPGEHDRESVFSQSDSMGIFLATLFESVSDTVSTASSNAIMDISANEAAYTSVGGTTIIAETGGDTAEKGTVDISGPAIELDPAMIPLPLDDDNDFFSSGSEDVLFPTLDEQSYLSVMIEATTVCTPIKDDTLDLAAGSFGQRMTTSVQSVCSDPVPRKTDAEEPAMNTDDIQPDVSTVGCCIDPALIPLPEPVEDELAINPLEVPLPSDDFDWFESDALVESSTRSSTSTPRDLIGTPVENVPFQAEEKSTAETPSREPKLIVTSTSSMSVLDAEADIEHDADITIFYPIGTSCSLVSYASSEEGSAPEPFSFDLPSLTCSDVRSPFHCEDNFSGSVRKENVEEEGKSDTSFFSRQNVSSAPHLCPGTPKRSTDLPCNFFIHTPLQVSGEGKSVDDPDSEVNGETKDSLHRSLAHAEKVEYSSLQSSSMLSTPGRYPRFIGL
ncbi:hypothetical protein ACEPAH_1457 [Sanghuangporus vaninii]